MRWPARPSFIATLRAQGMPATPADLAELYGSIPGKENAAPHYLKVVQQKRSYNADWYAWLGEQRDAAENTDAEIIYDPKGSVINGTVDLAPDTPLWDKYWALAQVYHAKVSAPTTAALLEVASADYARSHYPIDLGSGASANLSVLADLRDLARAQSFDVWMAAMEDRPQDALNTIVSMGAFAESLREEPMLMSQLVRIAIHGIMTSAIEQALNRTEFSESQLAELQEFLSNVLPAQDETGMIAQALIGERTFVANLEGGDIVLENGVNVGLATSQPWFLRFTRVVYLRCLAEILQEPRNRTSNFTAEIEESSNPIYILPKITVPALDRARDAEWRCRVSLDMAATACAVERYRLKYGVLPESLEVLVPGFMAVVPTDPFRDDSGPVSYRVSEDGDYVLYSWAANRTDEQGVRQDSGKRRSGDWMDGDWIFSVAPLSFRNGSQFTDVPDNRAVVDSRAQPRR